MRVGYSPLYIYYELLIIRREVRVTVCETSVLLSCTSVTLVVSLVMSKQLVCTKTTLVLVRNVLCHF